MDKLYPQRLHKYELVLRGFYLKSLRLQIKPYRDFYLSHGYLGQVSDLISTDSLKTAYTDSFKYISDLETYRQWQYLKKDFESYQKDVSPDDDFLVVLQTLNNFFLQASLLTYDSLRDDLNQTSIDLLTKFVSTLKSNGKTDAEIFYSLSTVFEDSLRQRAVTFASTEASAIANYVRRKTAEAFYTQKGVVGYKTWLTRQDERVRHTHVEVDMRTLPIDSQFVLNRRTGGIEFADRPGDYHLSAANRVHCRCYLDFHADPNKYKKKGA